MSPQSSTSLSVVILIISCFKDNTVKTNDKNKSMRIFLDILIFMILSINLTLSDINKKNKLL